MKYEQEAENKEGATVTEQAPDQVLEEKQKKVSKKVTFADEV